MAHFYSRQPWALPYIWHYLHIRFVHPFSVNLSYFIARRIIGQRQLSFSAFIIRLATGATALSVATMIITLSTVNGFQQEVAQKVYSYWGHLRVQPLEPYRAGLAEDEPMDRRPALEAQLQQLLAVQHVQVYGARSIVLRSQGQFEGVVLKGVDSSLGRSPFGRFVRQGRLPVFPDSGYSRELLLSESMAATLQVKVGDTLTALFLRNGEDVRMRQATVCGLYKTGIAEYDANFVVGDLRLLQRLNLWQPGQVGGYEVWLQAPDEAGPLANQLNEQLPQGLVAMSTEEMYPNIFDWLGIQNQTKLIVIIVMLVVAAVNLITCLLILVMERTRMVATLAAMGMQPRQIGNVFWYYAAYIAGIGVALGLALALALLWLQQATGLIRMDESTYYVDRMPVHIIWWQVAAVVLGSLLLCTLALRLPLGYVRRISPIRALRFE